MYQSFIAAACGWNYLCPFIFPSSLSFIRSLHHVHKHTSHVPKIINEIPFRILHSQIYSARYNEMTWLLILMSIVEVVCRGENYLATHAQHRQQEQISEQGAERIWIFCCHFLLYLFLFSVSCLQFYTLFLSLFGSEEWEVKKRGGFKKAREKRERKNNWRKCYRASKSTSMPFCFW